MVQKSNSETAMTGNTVQPPVPDAATFNGLLLIDAALVYPGFTFRVAVFAIWQGEAILIERFEDEDQARAWLADAVRLVEWKQSGLDSDPSGLYWKQAGVPAWVPCWKAIWDKACCVTDEDYAHIFTCVRNPEEALTEEADCLSQAMNGYA